MVKTKGMRKILLSIFIGAFVSSFAEDKPIKTFTLKEAVAFALDNNTNVKNAKLGIDETKARNLEIITQGLPQITSSIDYTYNFKKPEMPGLSKIFSDTSQASTKIYSYLASQGIANGDYTIYNILTQAANNSKDQKITFALSHNLAASMQLTQLIFDGRYVFGIKATKDLMRNARLSHQMSEQDIRYTVTKAYYQAQASQEANGMLQGNLKLVDKLLNDTRAIFKEGLIEELDVNRLELIQTTLQSQINVQNNMAEVALANLKYQMGLSFDENIILKDNLDELKAAVVQDLPAQFDVTQRIEYDMLETAVRLQGWDINQKKAQYFPSLFGFVNYGWSAQGDNFSKLFKKETTYYPDGDSRSRSPWYDQGLLGLSLKIPIFDSGLKYAQIKQTKIQQLKTKNSLENFKNASQLQFIAARSAFYAAITEDQNSKKALDLSEKIFKTNTIKFTEGVGSSFELVQSQTDFSTNEIKRVQSALNLLNTKADLDKAMGVK